ncbi:MAG: IS200/IS605 family transposase [Pyrinomonadaceae bacterium]
MANTYSQIYLHIVFSTKNREPFIHRDVEERVWAFMGGIAKRHKMTPIQIGGIEDHAHVLVGTPTTISASQAVKAIKGDSSKWIHEEFDELRSFGWQDGYGVFSVSRSAVPDVVDYIKRQREHHTGRSFEDEYRTLLKLHDIDFDEGYLLG